MFNAPRLRAAVYSDLPRIHLVRHGTTENRLSDPARVTEDEIRWYMDEAIFFVTEDDAGVQAFVCANHQTGCIWALFVRDEAQGRGHGTALLEAALARLRAAGHQQSYLSTDPNTKAEKFYKARGWIPTGISLDREVVLRLIL